MTQTNPSPSSVRRLHPGCFALVMATGIVSIDVNQHGMPMLARALFSVNLVAFVLLGLLTALRLIRARQALLDDFTNPARGAAFLTFTAASCVLASQCLLVVNWPAWATATWWIPLLAILELWRHGLRHVRLRYEVDDWDIVFPLGMY
ncbi:MAG: hypothetical protein ABI178_00820, partial [Rhodanobacter sp.]